MTLNVCGGFGEEGSARGLIDKISHEWRPDFAVFPEAFKDGDTAQLDLIFEDLGAAGYNPSYAPYYDTDGRSDQNGILTVARDSTVKTYEQPTLTPVTMRLATRTAIQQWLTDPETGQDVQAIGLHLDDRTERGRLEQVHALVEQIDLTRPTIVSGDFNATFLRDTWSSGKVQLARAAWPFAQLPFVPNNEPTGETMTGLGRKVNQLDRAARMTSGRTMRALTRAGLHDTVPDRQPTFPADAPFLRLDYILASPHFMTMESMVAPADPLGDHRRVVARLALTTA